MLETWDTAKDYAKRRWRYAVGCKTSRLDVGVKKYAVVPSQRLELALAVVGLSAFVIAPVAIAGAHPVALALAAVSLFGVIGSVLFYRRRQRSADIRDLLAIVERTFGPLELSSAGESPRRRESDLPS